MSSEPDRTSRVHAADRVLAEWQAARPDLDATPIRIFTAVAVAGRLVEEFYEASASRRGLLGSDFFLLAELRRQGEPFQCTPGQLSDLLVRSTGGMTKQLDRLAAAKLIKRIPNPDDRRSSLVQLTAAGRKLIDAALEDHFTTESRILSPLDPDEIDRCVELLRVLARQVRRWGASHRRTA